VEILTVSAVLMIFKLVNVTLWDLSVSPFTPVNGCPAVASGVLELLILCQLPVKRCQAIKVEDILSDPRDLQILYHQLLS